MGKLLKVFTGRPGTERKHNHRPKLRILSQTFNLQVCRLRHPPGYVTVWLHRYVLPWISGTEIAMFPADAAMSLLLLIFNLFLVSPYHEKIPAPHYHNDCRPDHSGQ